MRLDGELLDGPAAAGARVLALGRLADAEEAAARLADPADAEALHDFRVAVRRLRSTLRLLAPALEGALAEEAAPPARQGGAAHRAGPRGRGAAGLARRGARPAGRAVPRRARLARRPRRAAARRGGARGPREGAAPLPPAGPSPRPPPLRPPAGRRRRPAHPGGAAGRHPARPGSRPPRGPRRRWWASEDAAACTGPASRRSGCATCSSRCAATPAPTPPRR